MGLDIGQYRGAEGKFELVDIIFLKKYIKIIFFLKKLFLTKHKNYF